MSERDDAHLMSGSYALHAVTPEEAALVEAAMRGSEDLRSEIVGLTDTAVALGLAAPAATPPPALRARLLEMIDDLPQDAPDDERAQQVEEPARETPVAVAAMPRGDHMVTPRRRRRRSPMVLLVSAVAAVVLFSGGFFVQRTLFETQTQFTQVMGAADVQQAAAKVTGGGTATVYWSKAEHRTAVVLNGVEAPSGKVLQLWSIRGGAVTSAGLYEPQGGEHYTLIPGTPNAGETLAVSVEPDGGSTQPTSTPIVSVPLRA